MIDLERAALSEPLEVHTVHALKWKESGEISTPNQY